MLPPFGRKSLESPKTMIRLGTLPLGLRGAVSAELLLRYLRDALAWAAALSLWESGGRHFLDAISTSASGDVQSLCVIADNIQ